MRLPTLVFHFIFAPVRAGDKCRHPPRPGHQPRHRAHLLPAHPEHLDRLTSRGGDTGREPGHHQRLGGKRLGAGHLRQPRNHGTSAKGLWIGLHDGGTEGTFAWSGGQAAAYRNWAAGEPSAGSAGEDFTHLYEPGRAGGLGGKWNVHTDQTTESGVPLHGVVELPLVVANVRAAQRAGTNLVDIDYDVTGTTLPVYVTLEVSGDDGATFAVPAIERDWRGRATDVAPGTNLRLTWDAGADWAGHAVAQARFRISADDNPIPPGFALIPAGSFQMGDQSSPLVGAADELPVHTVQVSAFYMGKYEVTKEEWDEVRTWGLANGYTDLPSGSNAKASQRGEPSGAYASPGMTW